MLLFNQTVFDEIITGTVTTWYTPAVYNDLLGSADDLSVIATPTNVVSTPSLDIWAEMSGDGQHWLGGSVVTGAIASGVPLQASLTPFLVGHGYVRFRMTLSGAATGQCLLRLGVAGHSL
jgi:hypothetical protein